MNTITASAVSPICPAGGAYAPAGADAGARMGRPGTPGESHEVSGAVRRCRVFMPRHSFFDPGTSRLSRDCGLILQ